VEARETTGRDRRRNRTRAAILNEALALMRRSGVEAIGIRELARRLDYSPAALYRYFGSREDIVATLAAESMGLLGERLRAVDGAGPEALVSLGEAYLAFAAEEPVRFRLLFVDLPSSRTSLRQLPPTDSPYVLVLEAATRAKAEGRITRDLDAESVAYTLWSLVHGMAVLESTHLRGFDANFARAHRVALEHLVNSWTPARRKGGRP
jgi:AcrR family transcriptional regulator